MAMLDDHRLEYMCELLDITNLSDETEIATLTTGKHSEKFLAVLYSKHKPMLCLGATEIHAEMYEVDFEQSAKPDLLYSHLIDGGRPLITFRSEPCASYSNSIFPLVGNILETSPALDIFYNFLYTQNVGRVSEIRGDSVKTTRKTLQQSL